MAIGEPKMKVWLLTVGDYSGFRVLGVFDEEHKELAEQKAKLIGGSVEGAGFSRDEPIEVNVFDVEAPPSGTTVFVCVRMKKSGDCNHQTDSLLEEDGKRHPQHYRVHNKYVCKCCHYERDSYWELIAYLYAKSEQHAIKIVNDLRIRILTGDAPSEGTFAGDSVE